MKNDKREIAGARASIFWQGPNWEGEAAATIGDFKCDDASAGAALLNAICKEVKAAGTTRVLGPMNGDTWHSYRLVVDTDGSPPFLMEPQSKSQDLEAFKMAGFEEIARYFSAQTGVKEALGAPADLPEGIRLSNWDGSSPEAHFAQVHELSKKAFANNLFYQEIDLPAFLALYMPFVPLLKPDLIFTAHDTASGELVGYLFGIPNYGSSPEPDTVILKTYASLRRGLGHSLAYSFHERALNMGFTKVIHALIHDDNVSADRSRRHSGEVFRRYALMGRRLND